MEKRLTEKRYNRLILQIEELCANISNPISRMATINAILHHKMDYYFWTGFYILSNGKLLVGPYQGSLACLKLEAHTGVCWLGIDKKETVIVDDVHNFKGHIACSSKSKSEIVVPVYDENNVVIGVFDVDSESVSSFDEIDKKYLEKICRFIYK